LFHYTTLFRSLYITIPPCLKSTKKLKKMEITNIDIYMSMITNIEERIAEEVRKYPHLYNTSLKDYKDARTTANSAAVELDTKDCDCFLFHSLYITIPPYLKSTKKLKKMEITNIEERIAEEVRKYPHLYNTSLKDYKDARITANSAAVELDTKDCDCFLFHSLYITISPYLKPT